MSTIINYQLRAHMSLLGHIDTSPSYTLPQCQPPQSCQEEASSNSADGFWSSSTHVSPTRSGDSPLNRVTTDIRISLKNPSPEIEQDSDEFRRQAKEIKKDIQRISKYKSRHSRKKSKTPDPGDEDERRREEELRYEHEFRRRLSVHEGREFLADFVRHHFTEHVENITIKSTKSLEEIRMIGNEELAIGVRMCRRLFNAPVISDQVGLLLWQELSQGDALDHSHEVRTDDEAEKEKLTPEVVKRRRTEELEERMSAYIADRQAKSSRGDPLPNLINPSCLRTINGCRDVRHRAPMTVATAMLLVAEPDAGTSLPMKRRALDSFLDGVKQSAVKGATRFASSLATGYA